MVSHAIEHEVVSLTAPGEIFVGVVDDMVGADRSDQVHISRAAHTGHVRAERFGDLHGERTHTSRRTVDQDLLAWLNPSRCEGPARRSIPRSARRPPARMSGWPA